MAHLHVMNRQAVPIRYALLTQSGHLLESTSLSPRLSLSPSLLAQFNQRGLGSLVYSPGTGHPFLVAWSTVFHHSDILIALTSYHLVNRAAMQTLTDNHGILGLILILTTIGGASVLASRFRREFTALLAVRTETDATQIARSTRVKEISQVAQTWAHALLNINNEKLRAAWLANHDPLTQLCNRRGFLDRMTELATSSSPSRVAFILFDLDHFKHVNDTYGHGAGDSLLHRVGEAMRQTDDGSMRMARIGGDEFAMTVTLPSPEHPLMPIVQEYVSRILSHLRQGSIPSHMSVTFSVGATVWDHQSSVDQAFFEADLALYASKDLGRNRLTCYSPELYEESQNKIMMGKQLVKAIAQSELTFRYQPITNLDTRRLQGVEALLRWQRGRDELLPDQFLPYITDPLIMQQLEDFIVRTVILQAQRWYQEGLNLPVTINVTPQYFLAPDLPEKITALIRQSDVPSHLISLEVVGNAQFADLPRAIIQVHELRQAGIMVGLDNFGTGYASLSYLLELPVHYIKLDKSFTANIRPGSDSWIMVSGVVALCQAMGRQVITEGIETQLVAEVLNNMGVTAGQGDWLGSPMTPTELADWIPVYPKITHTPKAFKPNPLNLVVMIPYQVIQWAAQVRSYVGFQGTAVEKRRLLDDSDCLCGVWINQLGTQWPDSRWNALRSVHDAMHHAATVWLQSNPPASRNDRFEEAVHHFLQTLYRLAATE